MPNLQKLKDNNERQEIFEAASKKHDHDFNSRLEDIQQKVSEVTKTKYVIWALADLGERPLSHNPLTNPISWVIGRFSSSFCIIAFPCL